jgi:hypothetical protein
MDTAPVNVAGAWQAFRSHVPSLTAHAQAWTGEVLQGGDLATRLAQFARQRVK